MLGPKVIVLTNEAIKKYSSSACLYCLMTQTRVWWTTCPHAVIRVLSATSLTFCH